MPSHSDRVRRNYQVSTDDAAESRRGLLAELHRYAERAEDGDRTELRAAVDGLTAAVATGDEVTSWLDVLDIHISRLPASDTQTSLTVTLSALRDLLAPEARG